MEKATGPLAHTRSQAARVGEQVGLTWKSVKRVALVSKLSRCGAFKMGLPMHERSPMCWSSAGTGVILGRLPAVLRSVAVFRSVRNVTQTG